MEVFIWYPENSVYDIMHLVHHAGGETEIRVDQRVNFAQWVPLGSYRTEGTFNLEVHGVTSPSGGRPFADAVRFVLTPDIPVSGVTIPLSERQLVLGSSTPIIAVVQPTKAYNKAVSWESDNTSVASVSSDGMVTAHALGTATITVTTEEGGFTAQTIVEVVEADPMEGYNTWRLINALPAGLDTPEADANGNGIANLIEYAMGVDHTDPRAALAALQGGLSNGSLALTFPQIGDPWLNYRIWASSDLLDWGTTPIWSSTGAENQVRTLTIEDVEPLSPAAPRFLRLQISLPQ